MRTQEERDRRSGELHAEAIRLAGYERPTTAQQQRAAEVHTELVQLQREDRLQQAADGHGSAVIAGGADTYDDADGDLFRTTMPGTYATTYGVGRPLARGQSFTGYAQATGLVPHKEPDLSLGKVLRGITLGDWTGAEAEQRAMSGASGASGGYLLPVSLSAAILDRARARTRVLQAGARVLPMNTRQVDVAVWEGDPTLSWHTENAVIPPSDGALGRRTLTARTLAGLTAVSLELLEDGIGVEDALVSAFVNEVARLFDLAALYGSGTAPEPRGIRNSAAAGVVVDTTTMTANGSAPTSYAPLLATVGAVRDADEEPTAILWSPRTARKFGSLADTTGQPLGVPSYLDGVQRLETSIVPNNLSQGTSSDVSDVIVGDFRQLLVGVRTQLRVDVLRELYRDKGQVGFAPWFRGDVVVGRGSAFRVLAGVR